MADPRLTSVERVKWTLRAPRGGPWLPGGDEEARLLEVIAAAEAHIVTTVDPFLLAGADGSVEDLRCDVGGWLDTPRYAAAPTSVRERQSWSSATEEEATAGSWEPAAPPTPTLAGKDLVGGAFVEGRWYRVLARWGWAAIPPDVDTAAALLSARLWAGQPAPAAAREENIAALLRPYRRVI